MKEHSHNHHLPLGETHDVYNIGSEMPDLNLFESDAALKEAVAREGGQWGQGELRAFGEKAGRQSYRHLGWLANRYAPELDTHDRFGRRVDLVRYHDSYHQLMQSALENGLHASPWLNPREGAHTVRAAKSLMQSQVEAGHGCPVTMTFASIPSIRIQPEVAEMFEAKILDCSYDPSNRPFTQKQGLTVGMGMTEKQGGSDVRANSTQAVPLAVSGPGQMYSLTGHKWFLSAPMCDLFLILAQTGAGVSCFAVPRWLPDGSKNGLQVIRLKDKMGNKSNASSEVEFRGAQGWLIGEEGRGVPTIIEMVSLTRFDCMLGSTAGMRAGLSEIFHHCGQRAAFGAKLKDQPLMQNVLADLSLEYEASLALSMRMARALDSKDSNDEEARLLRLATAVGKYWICKRGPQHAYETMECMGGSGVMENSIFPRLFRESVINPIWEGSGNVQCLDVLRAIGKDPSIIQTYLAEVLLAKGGNAILDEQTARLLKDLKSLNPADPEALQFNARHLVDRLALILQASLLVRSAPSEIADVFCQSRLAEQGHHNYGTLQNRAAVMRLMERADPFAV